jgi:hypothetical protein
MSTAGLQKQIQVRRRRLPKPLAASRSRASDTKTSPFSTVLSVPPLIEELKKRQIPFGCAGRTGLFLQPEASVPGNRHLFAEELDRLGVVGELAASVDDDVILGRRQVVNGLPVPEQADVGKSPSLTRRASTRERKSCSVIYGSVGRSREVVAEAIRVQE